jgi:hypothetical protein
MAASSTSKKVGRVLCHIGELTGETDGYCSTDRSTVTTLDQCRKGTRYDHENGEIVTDGELIASRVGELDFVK